MKVNYEKIVADIMFASQFESIKFQNLFEDDHTMMGNISIYMLVKDKEDPSIKDYHIYEIQSDGDEINVMEFSIIDNPTIEDLEKNFKNYQGKFPQKIYNMSDLSTYVQREILENLLDRIERINKTLEDE